MKLDTAGWRSAEASARQPTPASDPIRHNQTVASGLTQIWCHAARSPALLLNTTYLLHTHCPSLSCAGVPEVSPPGCRGGHMIFLWERGQAPRGPKVLPSQIEN